MPKTKFQSFAFTLLMVFCMVYCMTVYTVALKCGGLRDEVFALALKEMWLEYLVVFCLIFFVITKTAQKLAFRVIRPGSLPAIFIILSIQCFTVCQIVPVITLFATFVHKGGIGGMVLSVDSAGGDLLPDGTVCAGFLHRSAGALDFPEDLCKGAAGGRTVLRQVRKKDPDRRSGRVLPLMGTN